MPSRRYVSQLLDHVRESFRSFPAAGEYTVYVCLDADDDALSEGLAMAHSLVSQRGHVVVCMRESSPFAGVLAARSGLIDDVMGRLSVFGVIEEACVPANIRDDFTEQLARSIHSAYVAMEAAHGRTPGDEPVDGSVGKPPRGPAPVQHRPGRRHRRQDGGDRRDHRP